MSAASTDPAFQLSGPSHPIATNMVLGVVLILFCAFYIVMIAIETPYLGSAPNLVDFDAFYVVGIMAQDGRIAEAYHLPNLVEAYRTHSGLESFMPWTYPPQFDLIVALLPALPRGLSYLVFTGLSFLAFLWVLHRLAGVYLPAVLAATLPILYIQLACGQNGFLTAAILGWMALWVTEGRRGAGLALGLMVIKPHMGIGLGLWALVRGEWRLLAQAVGVTLASGLLATLVFGPAVWGAFRGGVAEAAGFLEAGLYPFFRMTSLYAGLHRLGVDPGLAMAAQITLALVAVSAVIWFARRAPLRHALAMACAGTLLLSPYTYDYDLTLLAVAFALVARDLFDRARLREILGLMALVWVAGGWGLARVLQAVFVVPDRIETLSLHAVSIGSPFLVLAIGWTAWILRRPLPARGAIQPV